MPDTIYYLYERTTGAYAGNGITEFNDETYASTTVAPPDPPAEPVLRWNAENGTWEWVTQA